MGHQDARGRGRGAGERDRDPSAFITYDKRLEEAAVAHQLPVVVPKDE